MKTILVTGSAGFIGFHIAKKLLDEGLRVVGIDNLNLYYDPQLKLKRNDELLSFPHYSFFKGDINNENVLKLSLQGGKIDAICHMAAQAGVRYSLENPLVYEHANIRGFMSLIEFARTNSIQDIVYASSSSVYGKTKMPKTGFSEQQQTDQPISIYGMTKRTDELIAYTYHSLFGLNMTGLRFFTAYGPWGRPDMAYYKFTEAITQGQAIEIYNNGEMKRDFTYIDDIIEGVYKALQKPFPYEIFNLGNSTTVPLLTFVQYLEEALGIKAKKKFMTAQLGDLTETYADISHAKDVLGYAPTTDLKSGLSKFVQWYKDYAVKQ